MGLIFIWMAKGVIIPIYWAYRKLRSFRHVDSFASHPRALRFALRSHSWLLHSLKLCALHLHSRSLRSLRLCTSYSARQLGRFTPSGFALAFLNASLPQALCFAFAFSVSSLCWAFVLCTHFNARSLRLLALLRDNSTSLSLKKNFRP